MKAPFWSNYQISFLCYSKCETSCASRAEPYVYDLHQEGDPPTVQYGSNEAHCLLMRNLLFDLELLSHADYFVGTTKSGLSPIIEVRLTPFIPCTASSAFLSGPYRASGEMPLMEPPKLFQ